MYAVCYVMPATDILDGDSMLNILQQKLFHNMLPQAA